MESLAQKKVEEFLAQLGSDAPTPGGGGAAALAGASAAGLVTMVARLTSGRETFAAHEHRMSEIITIGDMSREELLKAVDGDANAFDAVMSAYRLPKATPEEKTSRAAGIQEALKIATESPLGIARSAALMAELAAELAEIGNPLTVSDAGTAAILGEASVQGALLQAKINLKSIKDTGYVEKTRAEIEELIERASTARFRAASITAAKLV
jgi:formiminotetrahydrofolate cyclodeaminase